MPLVLSVGLTKKLGLPAYSSVGARCNVQVEVDARLLERDPEAFQQHGQEATRRQLDYLRQLAGQIHGLGIRRLEGFVSELVGKPLAGLSSHDASRLIDALKAVKAGRRTLDDLTKEAEG